MRRTRLTLLSTALATVLAGCAHTDHAFILSPAQQEKASQDALAAEMAELEADGIDGVFISPSAWKPAPCRMTGPDRAVCRATTQFTRGPWRTYEQEYVRDATTDEWKIDRGPPN